EWMIGHGVMGVGVALPFWRPGIAGIMIAALLVGGTFMVVTQAGMQEARAVGGPRATRLMAAMTAAFATGQVLGPLCVSALAGRAADFSRALALGCAAPLACAGAPSWTPRPAGALSTSV